MNKLPDREFKTAHAEPGERPLWIGLFGPSGGGKTYSALKLAKGIQSVVGGKIEMIDTESGRGKHYAEMFDYEYTAFPPPHGSLDYLAAITHAVKINGSRIVIIDSFSHEHEGEGGLIEFHEAEMRRLGGDDFAKQERVKMLAWTKPKAARKQLLRGMLAFGTQVVFILCFRADEQSKPIKVDDPDHVGQKKNAVANMGFMPIAGKPFVYEATICALLMPGANGVPTWNPENVGEKMMRKLPEQFKAMFEKSPNAPLSEEHGRKLAEWAKGSALRPPASGGERESGNQGGTGKASGSGGQTLQERTEAAVEIIKRQSTEDDVRKTVKKPGFVKLLNELEAAGLGLQIDRINSAADTRIVEIRSQQ